MGVDGRKLYLVNEICKKLNEAGLTDEKGVEFSAEMGTGKSLTYLPESNLEEILERPINTNHTLNQELQEWERLGLLSFTPYIFKKDCGDTKFPVLVLKRDRFLMLRASRFVIFETEDCIGLVANSSDPIDFLLWADKYLKSSKIGYMLWWASLLDCACNIRVFRTAMVNHANVVETFLHETMRCFDWNPAYSLDNVLNRIVHSMGNINIFEGTAYQLSSGAGIKCRFKIDETAILLELAHNNLFIFHIPGYREGIVDDEEDSVHFAQFREYRRILEAAKFRNILLHLLLSYKGIILNYAKWAAIGNFDDMYIANSPRVHDVASLCDVVRLQTFSDEDRLYM